ncbi:sodium:proton exchanger [Candidatus Uhrbacteria bacterium]|jgi:Kef-type K+ transport system membrane component KefB|nr:sodium:proton exchanger [Candidatus Uhrbacteria bacterium]
MFSELFLQLAVVLVAASILALVTHKIKQPLIIAYIFTGLIVGPGVLGITHDPEVFQTLSEIGIAFLLFLVGINLNWRHIKEIGLVALMAGLGQALVTSGVGYAIGLGLGFDTVTSLFLGVAFAFSSTIIVVKLLSDKEDLERLYGRISIGVLIVQDLLAMIVLIFIGALRDNSSIGELITVSALKVFLVVIVLWAISHLILPRLFKYAAQSQELLFLSAIGWCFLVASVLFFLGFGIEIGALLAGIALAGTGFQREIESRVKSLRDFFLVIFFIVLGMNLTFGAIGDIWMPSVLFSLFVLVGNPLIVLILLRVMGYHPRTGFMTGTTVAQISEFSFIVLAGGIAAGVISPDILPMATVVGLTTIALSSYMIIYNDKIYKTIEPALEWLIPKDPKREKRMGSAPAILLCGYRDMGGAILPAVKRMKKDYLVIDFDPYMVEQLEEKKIPSLYGDVGNEELLSFVRADKAEMIISTIPDLQVNSEILRFVKRRRSRATIIVAARTQLQAQELYDLGATFVIVLSVLGGTHFSELLEKKKGTKRQWAALGKKQQKLKKRA